MKTRVALCDLTLSGYVLHSIGLTAIRLEILASNIDKSGQIQLTDSV
jgi:hypothetical protein